MTVAIYTLHFIRKLPSPPLFLFFLPPTSLPLLSFLPPFLLFLSPTPPSLDGYLQPSAGQQKMQSATLIHWSVRRRETPKQTLKEEAERTEGEEENMLPCLLGRGLGPRSSILPETMPALL